MQKLLKRLGGLLLLACAATASGEKADSYQAMTIDADRVTVDEVKRTSVFSGHVVITQGTMQIKAEKVVYRQADEEGDYFITAQGSPINFRQKQDDSPDYLEAYAEQLEFDSKSQQARLMRKAILRRGKDEVRGDTIFYDMRTQQYEVKGGKTSSGANERIKVTIQPRKKPAETAPAPGDAR